MRILYTDGSCPRNGDKESVGGWAWVEVKDGEKFGSGSGYCLPNKDLPNTSIRMELKAIIEALSTCHPGQEISLYSDSAYCINGIKQKWYLKWAKTGKNSLGKIPANLDLWNELIYQLGRVKVYPYHVPGHRGHVFQEMCDTEAVKQSRMAEAIRNGESHGTN